MKKILVVWLVMLLLAGCSGDKSGTIGVTYFTDEQSGCQYVLVGDVAVTPRMEMVDGKEVIRGCKDWRSVD